MAYQYAIKLQHGNFKTVEGEKINQYFAMREEEGGWKVTHIPTCRLLTEASFSDQSIAKNLAVGITAVFKDRLSSENKLVLKNNLESEIQKRAYRIIQGLNGESTIINAKLIAKIVKEARDATK